MKQCKRCGAQLADTVDSCTRCGGIDFIADAARPQMNNQPRPQMQGQPVRPQGAPVRPQGQQPVRPQGAPYGQNQYGQAQGQPVRPQGNQMGGQNAGMRPQGQPVRPQGNPMGAGNMNNQFGQGNQMNNQFGQNNQNQMGNQFDSNMQNGYGMGAQTNAGTDAFGNEVNFDPNLNTQAEKKGLFGKGKKEPKAKKNKAEAQDMNTMGNMGMQNQAENPFEGNTGFGGNMGQPVGGAAVTPGAFGIITIKRWLIIWLQMCIPVWNIIFIIKTLTNAHEDPSVKNYIKAYLIMLVIGLVLGILSSVLLSASLASLLG